MKDTIKQLKKLASEISISEEIHWVKPNLKDELGEYFENDVTQQFLRSHGIEFTTEQELLSVLESGHPMQVDKSLLDKHGDNLTLVPEEFSFELKDPDYAKSYQEMDQKLIGYGKLTLPMPILLKVDDIYWGFAGNRRMNLAWNHGLPVTFYVVEI